MRYPDLLVGLVLLALAVLVGMAETSIRLPNESAGSIRLVEWVRHHV